MVDEILSKLKEDIQKERTNQQEKATKSKGGCSDCEKYITPRGQIAALDKVLKMVDSAIDKAQAQQGSWEYQAAMTFYDAVRLLSSGKKVAIRRDYQCPKVPVVRLIGEFEHEDEVKLDCVADRECLTYDLDETIPNLTTIAVSSYADSKNASKAIKYIYSTPQLNYITAVLEDDTEVPYKLDVVDLVHCYGGLYTEPVKVHLDFMKQYRPGVRTKASSRDITVYIDKIEDVVDWILHNVLDEMSADIVMTMPDGRIATISAVTRDSVLTLDHLSHPEG
jgi:hypothetical protein